MFRGYLLALCGVFILSPDALLVRLIGDEPVFIIAWRGLFSGMMILLLCHILDKRSLLQQVRPAGYWFFVVVLTYACSQAAFVFAVSHATVASVLVILAFAPLASALLSALFLSETVPLRTWVATLVCGFGLALLILQKENLGQISGLGAALACAVMIAVLFVILRAFPKANLASGIGFGNLLAGAVGMFLIGGQAPDSTQWPAVLWMGLLVSPVPFLLFTIALRHISAAETSLVILLESVLGSLWVWLVLAEVPTLQTLLSGALVIGTLALHSLLALKPKPYGA